PDAAPARAGCRAGRSGRPIRSSPRASRHRSAEAPAVQVAVPYSPPLEDDESGKLLVADELMLSPGGNEHRVALAQLYCFAFDLEDACSLEDDVDFVVIVRLLAVWLRCDEH